MTRISQPYVEFNLGSWTAADVVARFGPLPLNRIRMNPPPGKATVEDVVAIDVHEDRLCELIDGTLLEKTMGARESYLGLLIGRLLSFFVEEHDLGIALGADGMMQIFPNQVRIPDVSFISWERLKGSGYPDKPVPNMAPALAVEVLSEGNTRQEMDRKLRDYFDAGVRLVWYIDPKHKEAKAYTAVDRFATLGENDALDGGDVLPGLTIDLKPLFQFPSPKE